jgi:hypothetical protein
MAAAAAVATDTATPSSVPKRKTNINIPEDVEWLKLYEDEEDWLQDSDSDGSVSKKRQRMSNKTNQLWFNDFTQCMETASKLGETRNTEIDGWLYTWTRKTQTTTAEMRFLQRVKLTIFDARLGMGDIGVTVVGHTNESPIVACPDCKNCQQYPLPFPSGSIWLGMYQNTFRTSNKYIDKRRYSQATHSKEYGCYQHGIQLTVDFLWPMLEPILKQFCFATASKQQDSSNAVSIMEQYMVEIF